MTDLTPGDDQAVTNTDDAREREAQTAALIERAIDTARKSVSHWIDDDDDIIHAVNADRLLSVAVQAAARVLLRDRDITIRQQSDAIRRVTRDHGRLAADRDRAVAAIIVAREHAVPGSAVDRILDRYHDGDDEGQTVDDWMADGRIEPGPWRWAELAVTGTAGDPA